MARRTEKKASEQGPKLAGVVGGEPRIKDLKLYKPNSWNPNTMQPDEFEALKTMLRENGWARSDALLVWGTDENGKRQNVIINGEHRWLAASDIGMVEGPVVEMNGITRRQAVQWTIRLDKIRGRFDPEILRGVMDREFDFASLKGTDPMDLALAIGFTQDEALGLSEPFPVSVDSHAPVSSLRELVSIDDVKPHPRNYKTHPQSQIDHLASSLKRYGMWRDIVVAKDGTILAGHGIHQAARSIGIKRVWVVRFPLEPSSVAALKIVMIDNEVGRFSEANDRQMTDLLKEIAETS